MQQLDFAQPFVDKVLKTKCNSVQEGEIKNKLQKENTILTKQNCNTKYVSGKIINKQRCLAECAS